MINNNIENKVNDQSPKIDSPLEYNEWKNNLLVRAKEIVI